MSKCTDCDKFNTLADENEKILEKYNALKIKYDRYDDICYDYAFIGLALGIIITLIIEYFLTK